MAFLTLKALGSLGLKQLGENVLISDKASLYGCQNMEIGNNCRIDDFCILSAGIGGIRLGQYVHIACYSSLLGKERMEMDDFSGLSSRVSIYSSSDDYTGNCMTNPTVPPKYTNVQHAPVYLGKHVIIGAGAVILPGVTIGEGTAVGALSLVNKDCDPYGIFSGIPVKFIRERERAMIALEEQLINDTVYLKEINHGI